MTRQSKAARRRLTVYQRIMRADRRGTGLRLTADDISDLAADHAVQR